MNGSSVPFTSAPAPRMIPAVASSGRLDRARPAWSTTMASITRNAVSVSASTMRLA